MTWVKDFKTVLMNGNGSINYNKTIAKEYGMYAAILLGVLCYKYDYWIEKGQLTEDGYFFVTQEDIEEETGLSEYMQREALKKLGGIVSVSKRDMPKKNYYKIDYDLLLKVLTPCCEKYEHKRLKSLTSSDEKFEQQEVKDFNTTNKEITNKITNKDITNNVAKNDEYDTHHPIDESNDVLHRNVNYLADSKSAVMVRSQVRGAYPGELGEIIVKWYDAVGINRKITFKQIQEKLEQLQNDCNNDAKLVVEQIKNSYLNNYPAWYPPKAIKRNVSNSVSIRPEEIDKSGYRNRI